MPLRTWPLRRCQDWRSYFTDSIYYLKSIRQIPPNNSMHILGELVANYCAATPFLKTNISDCFSSSNPLSHSLFVKRISKYLSQFLIIFKTDAPAKSVDIWRPCQLDSSFTRCPPGVLPVEIDLGQLTVAEIVNCFNLKKEISKYASHVCLLQWKPLIVTTLRWR